MALECRRESQAEPRSRWLRSTGVASFMDGTGLDSQSAILHLFNLVKDASERWLSVLIALENTCKSSKSPSSKRLIELT